MKNNEILTLITARAGSKRLPNKNILNLADKPLIAWSINEALKSKYISEVIVSTDSKKIAEISEQYNATVPFIRPKYLSNDTATSYDVILHAINYFREKNDDSYKYILLLQPTSPLRTSEDINNAIDLFSEKQTKAVVSVCKTEHSPLWSNILPKDLSMKNFIRPEVKNKRSQDLPDYYRLNGAIYIADIEYFIENKGFLGNKTRASIMKRQNSIDIDNLLDFRFAELIIKEKNEITL